MMTHYSSINLKSMRNRQPLNVENTKTYYKILTTYIRFLSCVCLFWMPFQATGVCKG